jgi:predicted amidohydrolase
MLIYVANFPTRRIQAWNSLLVARAIENQSYTLGVNRTGIDGLGIEYPGESCVIDFEGNTIISKANEDGVLIAELDLEKQKLFRKNYPFLNDQDTFELR